MASVSSRRPVALTAPDVVDFASSRSVYSPLDQLGISMNSNEPLCVSSSTTVTDKPVVPDEQTTPLIPTLDFNLFRSPSIYSVDDDSSCYDDEASDCYDEGYGYGFVSEPEDGEGVDSDSTEDGPTKPPHIITSMFQLGQSPYHSGDESKSSSPATPRARRTASGDSITACDASSSGSRTTTPTRDSLPVSRRGSIRGGSVGARGPNNYPSLPLLPYAPGSLRSAVSEAPFSLQQVPVRSSRSMSGPPAPESNISQPQRSCTDPVRQPAPVAARPQHATVPETASVHGEQGSDWGEDENDFEWLDRENAPEAKNGFITRKTSLLRAGSKRLTRLRNVIAASPPDNDIPLAAPGPSTAGPSRQKKKRPIVIPSRAAPPPPPSAPFIPSEALLRSLSPSSKHSSHRNTPSPEDAELLTPDYPESRSPAGPVVLIAAAPPRKGSADLRSKPLLRATSHRNGSTHSITKVGEYSDSQSGTSRTNPRSRYAKEASTLRAGPEISRRGSDGSAHSDARSEASSSSSKIVTMNVDGRSPTDIVASGLARRKAGDLPKSAWLFLKATEAGSITGQIHWGIALRHGLGIARDDRRAFSELLNACDRSLSGGGIDLRAAGNMTILTAQQRKNFAQDTSIGLVELGNCYLDGVGVKRSADLALEYLRMAGSLSDLAAQEQLGHILSKGASGVKKDTREAAKWYRAALGNGSNIPGLAWVWKDKYNQQ